MIPGEYLLRLFEKLKMAAVISARLIAETDQTEAGYLYKMLNETLFEVSIVHNGYVTALSGKIVETGPEPAPDLPTKRLEFARSLRQKFMEQEGIAGTSNATLTETEGNKS